MRIRRERLKLLHPSFDNGHYGETHLAKFDIVAQTTVQTTVATEDPPPPPSTATSLGPTKKPPYKPFNRSRYQVHISTSARKPEGMVYSDPVRKYTKSCVLFFISLLITWVPSSINRVWALAHPGETAPFGLAYAAALVLQLTGFWNSIVYFTMSRNACKELFQQDVLPRLRRQEDRGLPHSRNKSPLIWHGAANDEFRARASRRASLDTFYSGSPNTLPVARPAAKPILSVSQTEITSAKDSVTSWDWSSKKGPE